MSIRWSRCATNEFMLPLAAHRPMKMCSLSSLGKGRDRCGGICWIAGSIPLSREELQSHERCYQSFGASRNYSRHC